MLHEVADEACVELEGGVATVDAVVAVGVDCHVELFVGLDKAFCQLVGVLYVYVVVCSTVAEKEVAFELADVVHGGIGVVAGSILCGRAHVAFGVNGIVVAPIGDGGYGDGCSEYVMPFHEA